MCYHIEQKTEIRNLENSFEAKMLTPELFTPASHIQAFDFPLLPILTDFNTEEFVFSHWGLIPHWAETPDIRSKTLNAKLETLEDRPSFRDVTDQRCILPITGFYEWKWLDSKGKRKEKYHISIGKDPLFALAGLYSFWVNPQNGKETFSFTLLTTQANPIMAEIHNIKKRMPLIMDTENALNWLKTGNIQLEDDLKTELLETDGQLNLFG